jgi:hypothetical protein
LPRILLLLFGTPWIFIAGFFDLLFMIGLIAAILPADLTRSSNGSKLGILAHSGLIGCWEMPCFYLGAAGIIEQAAFFGSLRGGLFLVVGLILFHGPPGHSVFSSRSVSAIKVTA